MGCCALAKVRLHGTLLKDLYLEGLLCLGGCSGSLQLVTVHWGICAAVRLLKAVDCRVLLLFLVEVIAGSVGAGCAACWGGSLGEGFQGLPA